jgi:acyl dehydratase
LSARPSRSRPALGVVEFRFDVVNQNAEIVMTQKNAILFLRRAAAEAAR